MDMRNVVVDLSQLSSVAICCYYSELASLEDVGISAQSNSDITNVSWFQAVATSSSSTAAAVAAAADDDDDVCSD